MVIVYTSNMYSKIMVPLDGSKLSEKAIDPAFEIAQHRKAEVFLVRAFEPTILPPAAQGFVDQGALHEQERADIEKYLKSRIPKDRERCSVAVLEGPAAAAVLKFAESREIELIVLTTRGSTGLERWLLGSVAERISRHAPCPVLSIGQKTLRALESKLET